MILSMQPNPSLHATELPDIISWLVDCVMVGGQLPPGVAVGVAVGVALGLPVGLGVGVPPPVVPTSRNTWSKSSGTSLKQMGLRSQAMQFRP